MNTNRISFLNTYIDNLTAAEAIDVVDTFVQDGMIHYIVTPNSDIIVKMQDDAELKHICDHADLILTDGQMLVKISRLMGNPIIERVCMTDFVWNLCDLAVAKQYSIFLFGGKKDVLEKAKGNLQAKYSRLQIAGHYSPEPGFENEIDECNKAIDIIRSSHADILMVFLGCPKQDKFIYKYKDAYQVPVSITMGGCVDFCAGSIKRAPSWMQKSGLEWLYRFMQEPNRLFKRYFVDDIQIFKLVAKYKV